MKGRAGKQRDKIRYSEYIIYLKDLLSYCWAYNDMEYSLTAL